MFGDVSYVQAPGGIRPNQIVMGPQPGDRPLTYADFRSLYPELSEQQAQQAYQQNQSIPSYYASSSARQPAADSSQGLLAVLAVVLLVSFVGKK